MHARRMSYRHGMRAGRAALLAGLLAPLLTLGGCAKESILSPGGPVGRAQSLILFDASAIMLAIILPTIVATLAFAWWYRASNTKARYLPTFAYSGRIELLVWSIPALTILFLGGIAWIGSHELDPSKPLVSDKKPLEVQVVALDWRWLFIYPDLGVASVNRVVAPAGTPVHFRITSSTVMNSFFVPRLGSQIYAMNGMASQLWLQADEPGTYAGLSAHFSGDGFADMAFNFDAMTQTGFDAWVGQTRRSGGPALDEAAYRGLLRQAVSQPYTYHWVQPGLFDAVVDQTLPPGMGPTTGQGGPSIVPRHDGDGRPGVNPGSPNQDNVLKGHTVQATPPGITPSDPGHQG